MKPQRNQQPIRQLGNGLRGKLDELVACRHAGFRDANPPGPWVYLFRPTFPFNINRDRFARQPGVVRSGHHHTHNKPGYT